jgi:FixJ family two-component response regulator
MPATPDRLALIVDDREEVAETLAEMCRAFGFTAAVAEQGVGMLALLQRHRPACVIVDVLMPYQDGYEALKEIAAYDPNLPVMLVSGYGDNWLEMGLSLGHAQGLTAVRSAAKPVRVQAVREFLEAVTGGPLTLG